MTPDRWVIGSLFSGIGGMPLAARWMGWDTAFVAEYDPDPRWAQQYAASVLRRRFPGVPNLGDIRCIDGRALPPVDVLTAGFPCQDISLAGRGAGITGARSGLWKHVVRILDEYRTPPRYVKLENSPALRTRGLDVVLGDLCALGYDAEWHCLPASAFGAPHQRDRAWILAYPEGSVDHPICAGLEGLTGDVAGTEERRRLASGPPPSADLFRGTEGGARDPSWWEREPRDIRVGYGIPHRVDRIHALGNTIVPTIPYQIFRAIRAVDHRQSIRLDIAA